MKRFLIVGTVSCLIFLSLPIILRAQQTPALKIGSIDPEKVIMQSEEGKEAQKIFNDLKEKMKKDLAARQNELTKLKEALERQATTVTPEVRAERERQYQAKLRDYQRAETDIKTEVSQKGAAFQDAILKDMIDIIRQVGETEKFSIIVPIDHVMYTSSSIDITDKVISIYNDRVKKKATAAPPK